jgi:hypothetical protein
MPTSLPSPWNDNALHRGRWDVLAHAPSTISADRITKLHGFLPTFWLTKGAFSLVKRAALPCPKQIALKRLRMSVSFLFNRVWCEKRLGAYAGCFRKEDFLIEPMSEMLVLDFGEPKTCHFTFILFDGKLLAATREEFALDDDFWIERLLLRSQLMAPNESPNT